MSQTRKPVALAIGATLAGGLMLSGSAFASTQLAQGYLLGAQDAASADKAKEGSCGSDKAGEGKCGVAGMDSDKDGKVSRAEFTAMHPDKAAEFDGMDTNKDGFMDADEGKAHHEGKCGADKKADDMKSDDMKSEGKAGMEGKCGEGKCGGSM
ncbi:MAG TPA: hypothetical protein VM619_05600 [Luteimonas sp.]|nr:hypothetical protein [Luteimonas sp.]